MVRGQAHPAGGNQFGSAKTQDLYIAQCPGHSTLGRCTMRLRGVSNNSKPLGSGELHQLFIGTHQPCRWGVIMARDHGPRFRADGRIDGIESDHPCSSRALDAGTTRSSLASWITTQEVRTPDRLLVLLTVWSRSAIRIMSWDRRRPAWLGRFAGCANCGARWKQKWPEAAICRGQQHRRQLTDWPAGISRAVGGK